MCLKNGTQVCLLPKSTRIRAMGPLLFHKPRATLFTDLISPLLPPTCLLSSLLRVKIFSICRMEKTL